MKKLLKFSGYILATVLVLVLSQGRLFANTDVHQEESLTAFQVIGGLALLLAVILIPLMKSAKKVRIR